MYSPSKRKLLLLPLCVNKYSRSCTGTTGFIMYATCEKVLPAWNSCTYMIKFLRKEHVFFDIWLILVLQLLAFQTNVPFLINYYKYWNTHWKYHSIMPVWLMAEKIWSCHHSCSFNLHGPKEEYFRLVIPIFTIAA